MNTTIYSIPTLSVSITVGNGFVKFEFSDISLCVKNNSEPDDLQSAQGILFLLYPYCHLYCILLYISVIVG